MGGGRGWHGEAMCVCCTPATMMPLLLQQLLPLLPPPLLALRGSKGMGEMGAKAGAQRANRVLPTACR